MGFLIRNNKKNQYTVIANDFIQNYMLTANGNFVKVYLLLQSACQNPDSNAEMSISNLADQLECTENDITRALRYWSKQGLLHIEETNGEITALTFDESSSNETEIVATEDPVVNANISTSATITPASISNSGFSIPEKQEYSPLQAEALSNDVVIQNAIKKVEQLLGTNITMPHIQNILYFICDIGFSAELLCTMYEVAVTKGHKELKYIEAIGLNWAKNGIQTREQALAESANYDVFYNIVRKALGINRNFAPAEREIMDSWKSYQFTEDIIQEACKRTVLQTGDTNLNYVASILKDWHSKGVTTLSDIAMCDEAHQKQKTTKRATKKPTSNQFNQFPQRAYTQEESSSLEKQLLGKRA